MAYPSFLYFNIVNMIHWNTAVRLKKPHEIKNDTQNKINPN